MSKISLRTYIGNIDRNSDQALEVERLWNIFEKDVSPEGYWKDRPNFNADKMVAFMANPSSFNVPPRGVHEYLNEYKDNPENVHFKMVIKDDPQKGDIVRPFVEHIEAFDVLGINFREYVLSLSNSKGDMALVNSILQEIKRLPKNPSSNQQRQMEKTVAKYMKSVRDTPSLYKARIRVSPNTFIRMLSDVNASLQSRI